MEDDIVLADEVKETCILILPPGLPGIGEKFLGVRDISDRSIKPYVEYLALGTFDRDWYPPVKVSAHSPRLESPVKPTTALPVHITLPLLMLL